MARDRFELFRQWLQGVSLLVILLGLLMAFIVGLGAMPSISDPIDQSFYPGTMTAAEKDFRAWTYGVWGATMVGWGIMLLAIVRRPFANKELWAWNAFATGLTAWFVIDTGFSLNFNVTINVVVNVAIFVLAIIPLLLTFRDFRS
ncbi:MAG: hypothetical protein A4E32_01900 [Methanomassiliicoccales archaeon PtaU1.Bin124]|nr:MAG: hypothetical protein A4E32_01900 [Methanomassiliicoccales archaeon PtaU1.Bin124]